MAATDRLKRKLLALPQRARKEIAAALDESAREITSMQRSLVPVESGTLRGTIRYSTDAARLRTTIEAGGEATTKPVRNGSGTDYDYALGVEFGTSDTPAEPFFFVAYRSLKKRAKSRISRAITKAAKAVAAGG